MQSRYYICSAAGLKPFFKFIFVPGFGVKELIIALSAGSYATKIAPDTRIIISIIMQ